MIEFKMMRKSVLTKSNILFIKTNRLLMSGTDMAQNFGVSKSVVHRYMRNNGLTAPRNLQLKWKSEAQKGRTSSSPYLDKIFKDWYLFIPVKTLARAIERTEMFVRSRFNQLGLNVPEKLAKKRKESNYYKPGQISFNKGKKQTEYMSKEGIDRSIPTRFKKGIIPHNSYKKDGIIVIRNTHPTDNNCRPYKWIRVRPGFWQLLHQYRWEKRRGKVPPGHSLWFKDQDSMNCTLKNLELITNAEKMRRNTIHNYPPEIRTAHRLVGKLKRSIYEKQNNGFK